jgi:hypothetical protein
MRLPRLFLKVDVGQLLPGAVDHDEASVEFFNRPRRRERRSGMQCHGGTGYQPMPGLGGDIIRLLTSIIRIRISVPSAAIANSEAMTRTPA